MHIVYNMLDLADLEKKKLQKMVFILNALDDGWSVKKSNDSYIFTKKHEGKKEIFKEEYLETFLLSNMKGLL